MTIGDGTTAVPPAPANKRPRLSLKLGKRSSQTQSNLNHSKDKQEPYNHDENISENDPEVERRGHGDGIPTVPTKEEMMNDINDDEEEDDDEDEKPDHIAAVASLENLGNTCYLNSVIQILRYTPRFVSNLQYLSKEILNAHRLKILIAGDEEEDLPVSPPWQLVRALYKLFVKMRRVEEQYDLGSDLLDLAVQPEKLLDIIRSFNPMFDGNLQQDAQELLRTILCAIQDATRELAQFHGVSTTISPVKAPLSIGPSPMKAVTPIKSEEQSSSLETVSTDLNKVFDVIDLTADEENKPSTSQSDCGSPCGPFKHTPRSTLWSSSEVFPATYSRKSFGTKPQKLSNVDEIVPYPESEPSVGGNKNCHSIQPEPSGECIGTKGGCPADAKNTSTNKTSPSSSKHNDISSWKNKTPSKWMSPTAKVFSVDDVIGQLNISDNTSSEKTSPRRSPRINHCNGNSVHINGDAHIPTKTAHITFNDTSSKAATKSQSDSHIKNGITKRRRSRKRLLDDHADVNGNETGPGIKAEIVDLLDGSCDVHNVDMVSAHEETTTHSNCVTKSDNSSPCATDGCVDVKTDCDTESLKQAALRQGKQAFVKLEKLEHSEIGKLYPHITDSVKKMSKKKSNNCDIFNVKRASVVENFFQGEMMLRTRCLECECHTERTEVFQDISIPIYKPRIDDSPDKAYNANEWMQLAMSEVECLRDDNKYSCEKCVQLVEAQRSAHYVKMPSILTFHLKRFAASGGLFGGVSKINDHVITPMTFGCIQTTCKGPCTEPDHQYHLYAVIMHSGVTISAGHYVAYVRVAESSGGGDGDGWSLEVDGRKVSSKSAVGGQWLQCDDSTISVLTNEEFELILSTSNHGTPYVLFYCRQDSL